MEASTCGGDGVQLRLDGTGPHQRDRDLRQVELHPAADEERAGEEFAVLAASHRDVERRQPDNDDRGNEIGKHGPPSGLALAASLSFSIFGICRIWQTSGSRMSA